MEFINYQVKFLKLKKNKRFKNDSLSHVAPIRILNIGNTKRINLLNFIYTLEKILGKKIKKKIYANAKRGCPINFIRYKFA